MAGTTIGCGNCPGADGVHAPSRDTARDIQIVLPADERQGRCGAQDRGRVFVFGREFVGEARGGGWRGVDQEDCHTAGGFV